MALYKEFRIKNNQYYNWYINDLYQVEKDDETWFQADITVLPQDKEDGDADEFGKQATVRLDMDAMVDCLQGKLTMGDYVDMSKIYPLSEATKVLYDDGMIDKEEYQAVNAKNNSSIEPEE